MVTLDGEATVLVPQESILRLEEQIRDSLAG